MCTDSHATGRWRQHSGACTYAIVTAAWTRHDVRVIGECEVAPEPAPETAGDAVFWVPDPAHHFTGVRLRPDIRIAGSPLDFRPHRDGWQLVICQPPVSRMEYLVELRHRDGSSETVTDPGNPRQVAGAFGPKSVIEFPSYQAPRWLDGPAEPGTVATFDLPLPPLGGAVPVSTWSPADAADNEPLPLVVVHDGPEYDALASLTRYLSAGVTGGWLPRLRAALLSPGPRDRWYSANTRYARALCLVVIPRLADALAATVRVGMGTSLGGLAMLHAHCRYPDAFDALFLQSGSFFCPRFDAQERWFPYYQRITAFVADVHDGGTAARPVPVVLTCGTAEENIENNRLMAQALQARGYPVALDEVPDAHNYTAWRDAFDPYLTGLLQQVSL
ncbi:MAG TPA: alpha/beta hydrolase-fold protein [Streptosporangiaceae bacterium]|nr:alpha/beta hydrolase-fold protein [Streptosporangiaceae bacterium]